MSAMTSTQHPLGRIPQFDPRSLNFPVRPLLAAAPRPLRSYSWYPKVHLDQGVEGACVGFGIAHELSARPRIVSNVTNENARKLYRRAQDLDEWPGNGYEGTSVLAGLKAAQELGFYSEYRWAFTEEEVARTVSYFGPVVIGVNWWTGMFEPDAAGSIKPTGSIAGGHCTLVYSLSVRLNAYRIWNSWGPEWGQGGTALISREDMAALLRDGGEAAIPVRTSKGWM